ncbi:MAG: MATE family efflux transporter [Clostridiales bacterium]|jgi:putative MATE family efflux protein|nr:MATE family efflux transporter [Clostridiales bacterium]
MAETNKRDMTSGGIIRALLSLALPIMGTQFLQMCYNLTDMFWLGRIGSDAVAASGTAGLFMWLSVGFMLIGRVGAEIGVSQSRGRGETDGAFRYSRTALYIAAALGLLYGAFLIFLREPLVGFFNFQENSVADDAKRYLSIIGLGIPFSFVSASVSGTFNASGNARTPFMINAVGLALNMVLDPVLIFPMGMGVGGAAAASVFAQAVVAALMLAALKISKHRPFEKYPFLHRENAAKTVSGECARNIFKWTLPICLESTLFCSLTMITSRFEVSFGAQGLAISRVGSQVESLTWLIGGGFGSALTSYVGQNFGAGREDRIAQGVKFSSVFMTVWGLFVTAVLFFGGGAAFAVFLPAQPELWDLGVTYMRILSVCQLPMCIEAVFASAFKGTGRTIPPSVSGITSNIIRVPLAYALSQTPLGLLGIWAAISFTGCLRGIWIWLWYVTGKGK